MIKVNILRKIFVNKFSQFKALSNIKLDIENGDFISIYGPNGCGKTTLLKIIAGLEKNFDGNLNCNNNIREIGFVFQNYKESLFPWMNNLDNITYFFMLKELTKRERIKKVNHLLEKYDLNIDLRSFPYQQSSGQQQLVSILRAMIYKPKLLILDEPLNSLDERIKVRMLDIIQQYWKNFRATILFVSHNLDDAMLLGNKIVVMRSCNDAKASILDSFKVDFSRPRRLELIESLDFFKLKQEILSSIRKDIGNE